MKVKVIEKFRDKYTGEIRKVGDTIEVEPIRRIELDKYVEEIEEETEEIDEKPKNRKKKGKV